MSTLAVMDLPESDDLRTIILTTLNLNGPLTDERLVDEVTALGMLWGWTRRSPQRIRTARAELTTEGGVTWTGNYGKTRTGNLAKMWKDA